MSLRGRGIQIKTPPQIEKMRTAGLLVGRTLEVLREAVRPGVTPAQLDALAERSIRDGGGVPSFLGYGHPPSRPRSAPRSTSRWFTAFPATGSLPTAMSSRSTAVRS